jgi:hypothetical protein
MSKILAEQSFNAAAQKGAPIRNPKKPLRVKCAGAGFSVQSSNLSLDTTAWQTIGTASTDGYVDVNTSAEWLRVVSTGKADVVVELVYGTGDAVGGGGAPGGNGNTNLAYTASPTNGVVTSDTGTDATLPLATGTNAGLMAPAQFTKLAGVATAATANSPDATLLNRANHTGTQPASSISDSTAAGRAVLTAADAAAQRTALGLGTAATQATETLATAAQGSKADTAVQPGAQLTQAAVTAATAAGVALLGAADAAAQRALLAAATQYDQLSTVPASGAASSSSVASTGVLDITLTSNFSLSLSGAVAGQSWGITVILRQDATGSRTVSWPSGTKWAGGAAPTLSTAANAVDIVSLFSVDGGATWFGALGGKAFA